MMLTKDQYEKASVIFAEYFVKNYPGPDTVIHRPLWHSPKILRAALHAIETALLTVPPSGTAPSAEIAAGSAEDGQPWRCQNMGHKRYLMFHCTECAETTALQRD